MPSRSKKQTTKKARTSTKKTTRKRSTTKRKLKKLPKGTTLHIFSDFDETMIPVSAGGKLVQRYFFRDPHNEPFYRRAWHVMKLVTPALRRKYFEEYYKCLRRIPKDVRHNILASIPLNTRWLEAVKEVRMEYGAKTIGLTIISRNCVDVIHDWIMQNRDLLREHNITIDGIIANRSVDDPNVAFVKERGDLKHVDYIGFGQLLEKQKKLFLDKHSIYIGDHDDEVLKDVVHEFIRV
ncbi:MAG: hypothetical protein OXR66_02140 [Candidatus Woesearchaeota archaeon]|nr:hypothetical protein [Candidatus Woesearchaeota archaeon]